MQPLIPDSDEWPVFDDELKLQCVSPLSADNPTFAWMQPVFANVVTLFQDGTAEVSIGHSRKSAGMKEVVARVPVDELDCFEPPCTLTENELMPFPLRITSLVPVAPVRAGDRRMIRATPNTHGVPLLDLMARVDGMSPQEWILSIGGFRPSAWISIAAQQLKELDLSSTDHSPIIVQLTVADSFELHKSRHLADAFDELLLDDGIFETSLEVISVRLAHRRMAAHERDRTALRNTMNS